MALASRIATNAVADHLGLSRDRPRGTMRDVNPSRRLCSPGSLSGGKLPDAIHSGENAGTILKTPNAALVIVTGIDEVHGSIVEDVAKVVRELFSPHVEVESRLLVRLFDDPKQSIFERFQVYLHSLKVCLRGGCGVVHGEQRVRIHRLQCNRIHTKLAATAPLIACAKFRVAA